MTALVLFDRDGTLIRDVPYNGDPSRVEPMPTAVEAVALLRAHGIRVGVITNQSAVGMGLISHADMVAVHERVEEMLGAMDTWQICPHAEEDRCVCRKPSALMVEQAAVSMGVEAHQVVVIGDIGTDVAAAEAAGARAILVPNAQTLAEDIAAAPATAPTLLEAARQAVDA